MITREAREPSGTAVAGCGGCPSVRASIPRSLSRTGDVEKGVESEREVIITDSPEETERLGEGFAGRLRKGDVVALSGDLGGGKTQFTRGLARGLGIRDYYVKSPSFTIVHVYEGGRLPLYHIDLYRMDSTAEVRDLGLEEYVYGNGVCVIEWAERAEELIPEGAVRIRFSYEGESRRRIEIRWGRNDAR